MKPAALTPRRYRKLARDTLFYASNWISALFVTLAVLLTLYSGVCLTGYAVTAVSHIVPAAHGLRLLLYPILYLLLSPLLVGLLGYYCELWRAAQGDRSMFVPPAVLFRVYESPRTVLRAWGQVTLTLVLCAATPLSLIPAAIAFRRVLTDTMEIYPAVLLAMLGITVFAAVLYARARLLPFLYLSAAMPERTLPDAVRRAWRLSADGAVTGILLQLELLLGALLSLFLTAGILFFLYVLPIAVFTYIGYCHDLSRRWDLD